MQVNNAARILKAAQSTILAERKGKREVIGFQDLNEAWRNRAEQKALWEAKGKIKRSCKRNVSLENREIEEKHQHVGI